MNHYFLCDIIAVIQSLEFPLMNLFISRLPYSHLKNNIAYREDLGNWMIAAPHEFPTMI